MTVRDDHLDPEPEARFDVVDMAVALALVVVFPVVVVVASGRRRRSVVDAVVVLSVILQELPLVQPLPAELPGGVLLGGEDDVVTLLAMVPKGRVHLTGLELIEAEDRVFRVTEIQELRVPVEPELTEVPEVVLFGELLRVNTQTVLDRRRRRLRRTDVKDQPRPRIVVFIHVIVIVLAFALIAAVAVVFRRRGGGFEVAAVTVPIQHCARRRLMQQIPIVEDHRGPDHDEHQVHDEDGSEPSRRRRGG
mmetsp:Transcript_1023/g.2277  ORF Transcript_1023/g.2277 Transcript_1023/m.2277 type:complete len:249 (+) Transcript_1023:690-1436(+)